jgi:hypothetical protein
MPAVRSCAFRGCEDAAFARFDHLAHHFLTWSVLPGLNLAIVRLLNDSVYIIVEADGHYWSPNVDSLI